MKDAILFGPFIGELGWEILRFSGILPFKRSIYKNQVKYIVFTRPDRFDLYGLNADILVPLNIDESKYKADCYRLIGLSIEYYKKLADVFREKYEKQFNILEHIYPSIEKGKFNNKNQFPLNEMVFDWKVRLSNRVAIDKLLPSNKKTVVLAPRYRSGIRRNWPYWEKFYEMVISSGLIDEYNFVICSKYPDYIKDKSGKIYDINDIPPNRNISLIGLTIECLRRSVLCVGSQSSIPTLSLLVNVPALEWGNEKRQHTETYNIKKTRVWFLDDPSFKIDPDIVFNKMVSILRGLK